MMLRTLLLIVLALASSSANAEEARYVEGPRRKAEVLGEPASMGLPISMATDSQRAQALFDQGLAQVFGGAHFEAERSFQTILIEDPDCPMAYWGLAQANVTFPVRAKWFARTAWLKRGLAGPRERRFIDALARYYGVFGAEEPSGLVEPWNPGPGEESRPVLLASQQVPPSPERASELTADYQAISRKDPSDLLARTLLVGHLLATAHASRDAIGSELEAIFELSPEYPAHALGLRFSTEVGDAERAAAFEERLRQQGIQKGQQTIEPGWMAPAWALEDAYGRTFKLADYRGKPLVVVNFLGFGCVHCMEQLQAILPLAKEFKARGIEIVAIGLQTPEELRVSMGNDPSKSGYPFPILCDPKLTQFKAYHSFDDFADTALHGTYLVDGKGAVRWHDISHLPYMDIQGLLDTSPGHLARTSK